MDRHEALRARMERLVAAWRRSGETTGAFAARHGISRAKLEYWKRRARPSRKERPAFTPVQVVPVGLGAGAAIEIALTSGDRLSVADGTSGELLATAIRALRSAC